MTDLMWFSNKDSLLINIQSLSKTATTVHLKAVQSSDSDSLQHFSKICFNLMLKLAPSQWLINKAKMWLSTGKCMMILIQKAFSGLILTDSKCKKERLLMTKLPALRSQETTTQSTALSRWEIKLESKSK
jgi:hypothetical protein